VFLVPVGDFLPSLQEGSGIVLCGFDPEREEQRVLPCVGTRRGAPDDVKPWAEDPFIVQVRLDGSAAPLDEYGLPAAHTSREGFATSR
jgi:hypothetical protein